MTAMAEELIRPENSPKTSSQATSPFGCFLAAAGVTLLALTKLGAAMTATVWAFSKLFGLPEIVMYILMGLGALPVLWAVIWTAGRAWHVERRLAEGLDVDTPVFNLFYYWKKA
jgi:hypothetical protein